ncbi:hypothetical protein AVEN_172857-1 [Araneus ventricosus]|uniref:Uncharacterized protein n=1 Tax=Araneus ventricosus TaxID=182803 RepID=A0A4Y2NP84_ARAVE|nr:hypothetical protein AVEN_172857-1 [Araneus ventricosus]
MAACRGMQPIDTWLEIEFSLDESKFRECCLTVNLIRSVPSGVQTFSRWCGAKIPTLALPTQEECKNGRGPARRELPHEHVVDGFY